MIPREIDDLMWAIAEGTDQSAIEEFGERYPNLREELLKRIRTIKALKSGNRLPRTVPTPTFQNTQVRPANWKLVWATFSLAILSILAFGVYRANTSSLPKPEVPPVNLNHVELPTANLPNNPATDPQPKTVPQNTQNPQGTNQPLVITNQEKPSTGLKTMKLESATLQAAILLIAEEDHMTVTMAKGTPNPTVKIDYVNMTPMDMLKDLGQQYAFTPVLDGEHALLIIPKKDEDEGQINGSSH